MSSRKEFVKPTKVEEDENTDSGFLSGPLSEQLVSGECDTADLSQEEVNEKIEKVVPEVEEDIQLDSGLDLCSDLLSNVNLNDPSSLGTRSQLPVISVLDESSLDNLPLSILFQQDDDGDTQLHIAAVHGCQKSISTLVRICPDKSWLDVRNDFGHTALHLAAMSGHEVVTRMLVHAGAKIGIRDGNGGTPLHSAVAAGHMACLQALLAPIPEQQTRRLAATLNQKNYSGQTCVHLAAMAGNVEALHTLVYYGADINAREGLGGFTALHIAAARGDLSTAQYLLERCAGVARSPRNYAGRTPRRLAARTPAAIAFAACRDESDSDSDGDEEMYDSEESLFERLRDSPNSINVA